MFNELRATSGRVGYCFGLDGNLETASTWKSKFPKTIGHYTEKQPIVETIIETSSPELEATGLLGICVVLRVFLLEISYGEVKPWFWWGLFYLDARYT